MIISFQKSLLGIQVEAQVIDLAHKSEPTNTNVTIFMIKTPNVYAKFIH